MGGGKDFFAGYGVHTFGVQVPIAGLDARRTARSASGPRSTGGRSRPAAPATRDAGAWVQVNRLGEPARQRGHHPDRAQGPVERARSRGASRSSASTTTTPDPRRGDQQAVQARCARDGPRRPRRGAAHRRAEAQLHGPKLADVLRLNLDDPGRRRARTGSACSAGDTQGWPNGRRLGDDVIDIAEQAVGGFLKGDEAAARATASTPTTSTCSDPFPYVADPKSGFDNTKGVQKP